MLSLVELAEKITKKLNEIGENKAPKYEFNVYAEIGENKKGAINGVLRTEFPQNVPVEGILNVKYDARVEFAVPCGVANFDIKNVEEIIGEFVKNENGKEFIFQDGKGLVTFTLTKVKDFKIEAQSGSMLPLEFLVKVNYTENVVTSGSKHWLLNGIEIPFLSESVIVEKNGITNPISGENYKKTLLTDQLKLYRFRFNYDLNSDLCSMLQRDLLEGSANKQYRLTYYDGNSFRKEEPFETTVSVYRTADTSSMKPESSVFDITFTDVKSKDEIEYYMGLIDNPFDGQTEDTMYFDSLQEQQLWFDEKVESGCKYIKIPVPNLDSIEVTNQVYEFDKNLYNVFDVTKKNYAVIKVIDEDRKYYFYYHVTNPRIGAENQVLFSMKLDSVQTYYFIGDIKFEGSFIQKTLLNRWVQVDENTIRFNGEADSKLFEREEIKNVAKRLLSRQRMIYCKEDGTTGTALDALNYQPIAWVYITATATEGLSYLPQGANNNESNLKYTIPRTCQNRENVFNVIQYPNITFCYPIGEIIIGAEVTNYENNDVKDSIIINQDGLVGLLNNNNGYQYIYTIKLSMKPPFDYSKSYAGKIDNVNINEIIFKADQYTNTNNPISGWTDVRAFLHNTEPTDFLKYITRDDYISFVRTLKNSNDNRFDFSGLIVMTNDYTTPVYMKPVNELPRLEFSKQEVYESSQDKIYNPKLNGEDYKELRITMAGASQPFPIDKLNDKVPVFEYIEAITNDVSKVLIRYHSRGNNGVFNEDYSKSYSGLITTNDFSLPIADTQINQYLANNKNAFLSFQTQQNYNREVQDLSLAQQGVKATTGFISNIGNMNFANAVTGISNSAVDMAFDEARFEKGQALRQTQFDLSIDNMRNAPASLMNANGSALFALLISKLGVFVEIYEGLDNELEIANDIMARDGYTYNQFDDIKKYDKIRRYYNYIKASIGTITGIPISNGARADLRKRFANGIRFWKKNDNNEFVVDYSKENYEEWIKTNYSSFEEWLENQ